MSTKNHRSTTRPTDRQLSIAAETLDAARAGNVPPFGVETLDALLASVSWLRGLHPDVLTEVEAQQRAAGAEQGAEFALWRSGCACGRSGQWINGKLVCPVCTARKRDSRGRFVGGAHRAVA